MAITSSVSLDISPFMAGLQKMQSALQSDSMLSGPMEAKMSNLRKVLLTGAVAFGAAVQRTYAAITEGGALAKMSRESGIAVAELMRLRVAMTTVGGSADDALSVVGKLENAVTAAGTGAAGASEDFAKLGLSAKDFTGLNMEQGVRKVSEALRGMRDPVEQNRLSMALLGRDAESMIEAFGAGGHIETVSRTLGSQAAVMQGAAGIFREIQKSFTQGLGFFDALKLRVQGFFVGLAAEVGPQVLQILNSFKSTASGNIFDTTAFGKRVGEGVAMMVQAFRTGDLVKLFSGGLQAAFTASTDFLKTKFAELAVFVKKDLGGEAVAKGFQTAFARVRAEVEYLIKEFQRLPSLFEELKGPMQILGNVLRGIFKGVFGDLSVELANMLRGLDLGIIAEGFVEKLQIAGMRLQKESRAAFADAGTSTEEVQNRIAKGLKLFLDFAPSVENIQKVLDGPLKDAFGKAWEWTQAKIQGGGEAAKAETFDQLVQRLRMTMAKDTAALQAGLTPLGEKTFGAPQGPAEAQGRLSRVQQVFGMFGSLGGGTVRGTFQTFDPMINQQKIANTYLKTISDNTKSKAAAVMVPAYQN